MLTTSSPTSYITITRGMRGYFAVHMEHDEDGFPSPQNSGIGSHKSSSGAEAEGRQWAATEGLPFVLEA